MRFENLVPEVRLLMTEEVQLSSADGSLYASPRLSSRGKIDYLSLLADAVANHDEAWLTRELRKNGRIKTMELRQSKEVSVPVTAAETLAEGEFNRFYIRGVCRLALSTDPEAEVEVYRAKFVAVPRSESVRLIGKKIKAKRIYDDLRATSNAHVDTALGVPAGPNSGLSVRLIKVVPAPVAASAGALEQPSAPSELA